MAELKTKPTMVSVDDFIAAVEHPGRRADALALCALLARVSGCDAKMWGPSIIGFGSYHYRYASGHEGDMAMIGFSPRKTGLVLYMAGGFATRDALMARLGKYRTGKNCLYVNRLDDVDIAVLEELAVESVAYMRGNYRTGG